MKFDFLNIKREREKKITRLHIILFLLVIITAVVVFIVVKVNGGKKLDKYKKLEKDLKTATEYYFKEKESTVEKGRVKIITMKEVTDKGYLQDEITNECKGYTVVGNYRDLDGTYNIEYQSYIKCGNSYKTNGYDAYGD